MKYGPDEVVTERLLFINAAVLRLSNRDLSLQKTTEKNKNKNEWSFFAKNSLFSFLTKFMVSFVRLLFYKVLCHKKGQSGT